MTNYERIKNMSVKEMAVFINHCENAPCMCCVEAYCNGDSTNIKKCCNGIKQWLESEVEETIDK